MKALLSLPMFNILLALSLKPRHGYELMQQVSQDTGGLVKLVPGTLYGSIKQLQLESLIEEMPFEGSERRRYYRLTKKGWDTLTSEMAYYQTIVKLAHERHIIPLQPEIEEAA